MRSRTQVESIRAIRLRATHQIVTNAHHMSISQVFSIRIACTVVLALGLNVRSRTQSGDTLAILFLVVPDTTVNCHPSTICPSVCISISQIAVAVRTGLNVRSRTQSGDTLAIFVLVTHHIVVNVHQIRILLSDCTVIA